MVWAGSCRWVVITFFVALILLIPHPVRAVTDLLADPFDADQWHELSKTVYSHKDPAIEEVDPPSPITIPHPIVQALKLVFYAVIAAVLIIVLFSILRQKSGDKASGGFRSKGLILDADDEFTTETLLRERYHEAIQIKDYRFALRYLYLILLRHLAFQNKIVLQKGKTNHHYLRELSHTSPDTNLLPITKAVEAAWFGNRTPDESLFNQMVSPWIHLVQPNTRIPS
jgi:hypothetical protein